MVTERLATIVPLERYADILAHLAHFRQADPAEVRERLGIDSAAWRESERHWSQRLAEDSGELTTAFSRAFVDGKGRLAREGPSLEDLGPRGHKVAEAGVVDATAIGAVAPVGDVLPFGKTPSASFERARLEPLPDSPDRGETAFVRALPDNVGETLPFVHAHSLAASGGASSGLTLEQYAMMRAELAAHPDRADEIGRRYGLADSYQRELADEDWRRRISGDAAVRDRFVATFEGHRAWLLRSGR